MSEVARTLRLLVRREVGGGAAAPGALPRSSPLVHEHEIDVGPGARIGSGSGLDVRALDESVPAVACTLERDDAGWHVRAAAPMRIGERRLAAGERAPIAAGDVLAIGDLRVTVADAPPGAAPSAERTASLARELVRELLAGPGGPELVVEGGPAAGKRLRLPPPEARVIVGRGEGASWVLLDPDLSRTHAAFDRGWDGVRVADLGSKNGTRVGAELAPPDGDAAGGRVLADGDLISLGATRLRFVDPAAQYLRRLDEKLGAVDAAPRPAAAAPPPPPRPVWPLALAATIALAAVAAMIWILL